MVQATSDLDDYRRSRRRNLLKHLVHAYIAADA